MTAIAKSKNKKQMQEKVLLQHIIFNISLFPHRFNLRHNFPCTLHPRRSESNTPWYVIKLDKQKAQRNSNLL